MDFGKTAAIPTASSEFLFSHATWAGNNVMRAILLFRTAMLSHSIVRHSKLIVVIRRYLFDNRMASIKLITPEQLQDKRSDYFSNPAAGNLVHIDVRNKDELASEGFIPFSYHIPLASLNERHLPDDKEKCELVFSCKAGGRSARAAQKALDLGYKNGKCLPATDSSL